MPNPNAVKLASMELISCDRCKNPFMMKRDEKLKKQQDNEEIVCENCIKLEERKKQLELGVLNRVIESQKEIEASIKEIKEEYDSSKPLFNKQQYLEKIKKKAISLAKSIELLQKIDESKEEKFIDDYKKLFEKMKQERD
ncbi:hypothetical protein LCGC14_0591020 [marine sediment metagenome]|uniref:Uncharacterized protein n=1 Tax=marine sediment metagenome TaxID=412755 RepID=A0A0F9ULX6_9ZZZZ|nr:hypothetical protein [archaeon]